MKNFRVFATIVYAFTAVLVGFVVFIGYGENVFGEGNVPLWYALLTGFLVAALVMFALVGLFIFNSSPWKNMVEYEQMKKELAQEKELCAKATKALIQAALKFEGAQQEED
jgi:hypothetical protein